MTTPDPSPSAETLLSEMTWLRSLARGLVADTNAAEDIVQDTCVAALQRRPLELEGGRLRAWLATVARNLARRRYRDEATRRRHESEFTAAAEQPAAEELERLRLQQLVAQHVLALREPYRTAVLLRYQGGLSYARIAARAGIRQAAARQRVSRGLVLLRERLDAQHAGDRATWCLALAPLARSAGGVVPIGTTLTLGGITMGAKLTTAAAALILTAVGFRVLSRPDNEIRTVTPTAAETDPARTVLAADAGPLPTPEFASEREAVALPGLEAPERLGALATADPDRDLHGRVIDPDGKPVPGARISVRRDDLREYSQLDVDRDKRGVVLAELESDHLGEFAVPLEVGRPYFLRVEQDGFAPTVLQDRYAGEFVEVRLGPPAVFEGRVVRAEDGRGIPAMIRGRVREVGSRDLFNARTEDDGTFRFEGLEAGDVTVDLHPEGAASPLWTRIRLVAGETVEHEFVCQNGYVVRGRVVDARTGLSIAGAQVSQGWSFRNVVTTNSRGEYAMEHFPGAGYYEMAVRATGYGRAERNLSGGVDGVIVADFELVPGRQAVGRVIDPEGDAVAGAYVAAAASDRSGGNQKLDWIAVRTDEDGRFELVDLRPDVRHVLYVVREGFATVAYDFPDVEREQRTIDLGTLALQEPFVLRGVVVGTDGAPLADCRVELTGVNDDRGLLGGSPVEGVESLCGRRVGRTDHRGRFSFADLAPAEYRLGVRPKDADWHHESVRVGHAGRVQELRIELQTGLAISGNVFDPAGEPLPNVIVVVQPKQGTAGEGGSSLTDAGGGFRVAGLEPGLFQLEAFPMEIVNERRPPLLSTVMDVVSGAPPLVVHLWNANSISGRVLDAEGRAVHNASVRALDSDGELTALTTTDPGGAFQLLLEGGQVVLLVATPPPLDGGAFYEFEQVDPALAARLEEVAVGTGGLVLRLPAR